MSSDSPALILLLAEFSETTPGLSVVVSASSLFPVLGFLQHLVCS